MNYKTLIIPVAALAVSGALLYGSMTKVKATTTNNWKQNLVETLASKLGVSTDKVSSAMTDLREERRSEMQSRFEERLNELVTLGKITSEQKDKILAKKAELQKEWEAKETERQAHREAMQKWASDNGIDLSQIDMMGGMGRGRGMGGRGMHGEW